MTEVEDRTMRALSQLRANSELPSGLESRLLEAIHARIETGGGPEGGESSDPNQGGPGEGGLGVADSAAGANGGGASTLAFAAKVVGATVAMSAAGIVVLVGVAGLLRVSSGTPPASIDGRDSVVSGPHAMHSGTHLDPPTADSEVDSGASLNTGIEPPSTAPSASAPKPGQPPTPSSPASEPGESGGSRHGPTRAQAGEPLGPRLAAELELMRVAKASHGAEALVQLEAHARDFPTGTLASERDGLRILALCELGRDADAQVHADAFIRRYPTSLQLPRLREACPALEL